MTLHVAMPARRRGQKLAFSFDEDELTLAWDAIRAARLAPGTRIAAAGFAPPAWFWAGTGLVEDSGAALEFGPVPTTLGPSVAVRAKGAIADIEAEARRLHGARSERPEPEWQRHRMARDAPDTERDFPLGAYVLGSRHDEVTVQRMALPPGRVVSFTTIGPGAAPTEFARLQEAVGAYHVVLAEIGVSRTVGIWASEQAPQAGEGAQPLLRRLFRTQGVWRHGVKFGPPGGGA